MSQRTAKVLGYHNKLVEGWGDEATDSRKQLPNDGRGFQLVEWQLNKTAHSSDAGPR